MTISIDPDVEPSGLLRSIYEGNLVVLTRLRAVRELADYLHDQLTALFAPHDPEQAHQHFGPDEMARMLGEWKPAFIHSEQARACICAVIQEVGLTADATYFDLPKPRTSFPVGHLTTGIAYAFPWHRDTWYGAPVQQVNWWLPVYPLQRENAMSFDLESFAQRVPNSSATFDYYENNVARLSTASQVGRERQARPAAIDHAPHNECIVLPAPGQILLFSGAQLHRSIPNTSGRARYSVDFRTVHLADLESGTGAPSLDAYCTGTAVRDFRRVADGKGLDEALVTRLFGAPPRGAKLVFDPAELVRPADGGEVPAGSPGR